ncbi:testis-expressed protein 10 homolog [Zophobas morio]|uniref:testis-expressed protein 10 homolog n=1 Tax=Zophobas morio TaxID=2755281 RepID=UPI003082D8F2
MPKRSKNKQKDFQKKRAKVGKTDIPKNATDTKFKSKAITLPTQSCTLNKQFVFTSKRNLTIKELLSQITHHNVNVRKDSLLELRDLIKRYPQALETYLAPILERILPIMTDCDEKPRKPLEFLIELILTNSSTTQIKPFWPLIVVYFKKAMTHIRSDIALNSMAFFKLFFKHHRSLLLDNGSDFLNSFLRLLSSNIFRKPLTTLRKFQLKQEKASSSVLANLSELLWSIVSNNIDIKENTFLSEVQSVLDQPYQPFVHVGRSVYKACVVSESSNKGLLSDCSDICDFIASTYDTLLNVWLESLGKSKGMLDAEQVSSLLPVVQIFKSLWAGYYAVWGGQHFPSDSRSNFALAEHLPSLQRHVFSHFPYSVKTSQCSSETLKDLRKINIGLAHMISIYEVCRVYINKESKKHPLCHFESALLAYINAMLSEKESFDPELLYVIELLICSSSVRDTIRLACVKSILSFFENLSERSALKKTLFCFLSKTFISCVGYECFGELLSRFLPCLPKLLWVLCTKDLQFTEKILNFLLTLGQRTQNSYFQTVAVHLSALFHVTVRRKDASGVCRSISKFGPFLEYPCGLQSKAISLLYNMECIASHFYASLSSCVISGKMSRDIVSLTFDLLLRRLKKCDLHVEVESFLKFLFTSLLGATLKDLEIEQSKDVACESLPFFGERIYITKSGLDSGASLRARVAVAQLAVSALMHLVETDCLLELSGRTFQHVHGLSRLPFAVAVSLTTSLTKIPAPVKLQAKFLLWALTLVELTLWPEIPVEVRQLTREICCSFLSKTDGRMLREVVLQWTSSLHDQRLTERVTRLLPVLLKINALSLDEQLSGAIFSFLRAAKLAYGNEEFLLKFEADVALHL